MPESTHRARLALRENVFWWGGRDILDLAAPFDGFGRVIRGFDRQMRGLVEGEFASRSTPAPVVAAGCSLPPSRRGGVLERLEA